MGMNRVVAFKSLHPSQERKGEFSVIFELFQDAEIPHDVLGFFI